MRIAAAVLLTALASGCFLSHEHVVDAAVPVDAHPFPPDLGPPPRDLGRDMPPPDMGMLPPCRELGDCRTYPGTICRRHPTAPPDDLAEVPLVCAPPNGGVGVPGAVCDDSDELSCQTGLCVLGGTCVEPCVPDAADAITDRCDTVWVRTSPTSMQHVVARTLRVLATDGLGIDDLGSLTVPAGIATPLDLTLTHATDVVVLDGPEGVAFVTRFQTATTLSHLYDLADIGPLRAAPEGPVSTAQSIPTIELPISPHERRDPSNRYIATVESMERSTMRVIGLSRDDTRSTLDIDVFYAGASGMSGRRLVGILDDAFGEMRAMYLAAGIRFGEIRVHELVGGLVSRWAVLPDPAITMDIRIDGLFTLSAGVPTASLSFFFIRSAGGVLGLAGGIPGPAPVAGSPGSGILIAADAIGDTPEVPLASVLEHEAGHYLGLFHTSEIDGTVLDPLADTPECRPSHDTDGDGFLSAAECAGSGGEGVMFWGSEGIPWGFSPEQASVMSRSTALH